jgi:hypothetical protein
LQEKARSCPTKEILVMIKWRVSYRESDGKSNRLANGFIKLRVRSGNRSPGELFIGIIITFIFLKRGEKSTSTETKDILSPVSS